MTEGDICGATTHDLKIERICINPPHAAIYTRKRSSGRNHKGALIFSNAPKADQHYFVTRWPNQEVVIEE